MRRIKWVRQGIGLLLALAIAAVLAACGSKDADPAGEQEADVPESYPPATIIITSSSGWSDDQFWDRFNPIREQFPHHTIEYIRRVDGTRYEDLITAGQDIDIYWDSVAAFPATLRFGLGMDMTDLLRKHNVDLTQIEPSMVGTMRSFADQGELYGLPVLTNTLALFYNRDIFSEMGVEYPTDGITWDEINELNRRLTRTSGEKQYVGISYSFNHYWDINPFSIRYVENDKATINRGKFDPLFLNILNAALAPGYRDVMETNNRIPNRTDFNAGTAAMHAGLANSHPNTNPNFPVINWDVVRYPVFKDAPSPYPQAYPTYFAVSATSKVKDQSMEVLKYLVSEEFQLSVSRTGTIPVVFTPAILDQFAADLPYSQDKNLRTLLYPAFADGAVTSLDSIVRPLYFKNLLAYAKGEMDLNTLLRTAEEEANFTIEAFKAQ